MLTLLIGLRASGKSTIGPALAEALKLPFFDLDQLVARAANTATPAEALSTLGIPAFRDLEAAQLETLIATTTRAIISLGGGTPEGPRSASMIRSLKASGAARIIYLHATPAALRARLERTDLAQRPSITGRGTLEEVETLYQRRHPLYLDLANNTISIDTLTPEAIVQEVLNEME